MKFVPYMSIIFRKRRKILALKQPLTRRYFINNLDRRDTFHLGKYFILAIKILKIEEVAVREFEYFIINFID